MLPRHDHERDNLFVYVFELLCAVATKQQTCHMYPVKVWGHLHFFCAL